MLAAAAPSPAATAGEAHMMMQGKNYPLSHALAYETTVDGEERIVVVFSVRPIAGAKLKEVTEAEKEGHNASFEPPYLKLEFTKSGEFQAWSAANGSAALGPSLRTATGDLKLEAKRVSGKATQRDEPGAPFPYAFDVQFDTALLGAGEPPSDGESTKRGPAANVKPSVTGIFKGNGKEAKLAYMSAHWREPFDDKPSIVLVFTEKDHSKDPKPDFNASFGKFGASLTISLQEDGSIFGCQVAHPAQKKQGFTSLGQVKTTDFQFTNGKLEGGVTTDGPVDVFGESWEADLKFVAPLGEIPAKFLPANAENPTKAVADKPSTPGKPGKGSASGEPKSSQASSSELNVKDLALTKDASDFEYKALVEQLSFKSKADVITACAELAKSLKAQGWTTDGSDIVNATSSILNRKRGEATLTIFVKPNAAGSEVTMMTEGLSWDGV